MALFARAWKQATSGFATANKRIRRFLLNRALKQFLLKELDSEDSFDLNLADGLVTVKDLILNPEVRDAHLRDVGRTVRWLCAAGAPCAGLCAHASECSLGLCLCCCGVRRR